MIREIVANFSIHGEYISSRPYGSGHINDTYLSAFDRAGTIDRYIHQRINTNVFKDPAGLMENIALVTGCCHAQLGPEGSRRSLSLVPTNEGANYHVDSGGDCWRTYLFIEDAASFDVCRGPQQAYQAARAFGRFQQLVAKLPPDKLHVTIPDFHDTRKRYEALEEAVRLDPLGRAASVTAEIELARQHAHLARHTLLEQLPLRITHNDTKINNVLMDEASGEGLCVIDLDTVMPGLSIYDFGDMVRSFTTPAVEDERDLSKVTMQLPIFEALVRGYLESDCLLPQEIENLVFGGQLITYEVAIRFLTDYLQGDGYFKTVYAGQNRDRCRTHFKLLESMLVQEVRMQAVVAALRA